MEGLHGLSSICSGKKKAANGEDEAIFEQLTKFGAGRRG